MAKPEIRNVLRRCTENSGWFVSATEGR